MPPLPEADKNLVMHVELQITGGHWLMGTDAPESMGFTVNFGNNVYINLEPDTKAETKNYLMRYPQVAKYQWNCRICFGGLISVVVQINLVCIGCLTVQENDIVPQIPYLK